LYIWYVNPCTFIHRERSFTFHHHAREDHISRHLLTHHTFYESEILDYIADSVPAGGTWIDVGACIGTHSVYFATFTADKVLAFEPLMANYAVLIRNLRRNQVDKQVTAYPIAISAHGGTMAAITDPGNYGATSLVRDGRGKINSGTPQEWVGDIDNIRLIKIDCESMSLAVFRAFLPIIREQRPYLCIEVEKAKLFEIEAEGYKVMNRFAAGSETYILKHEQY